jgi:hypothetical protein
VKQVVDSRATQTEYSPEYMKKEGHFRNFILDSCWILHDGAQYQPVTDGLCAIIVTFVCLNLLGHSRVPTRNFIGQQTRKLT